MAKATILVVEDENDIRDLLAFTLSREGFVVLQADSGPTALEQARSKQPDLILLDLMLPGMDGLSVYKLLQRESSTSCIPVIMLTAKGEEIDRIVGLEIGAADYIVKPFSLREVILRIRAALGRGKKRLKAPFCNAARSTLTLSAIMCAFPAPRSNSRSPSSGFCKTLLNMLARSEPGSNCFPLCGGIVLTATPGQWTPMCAGCGPSSARRQK